MNLIEVIESVWDEAKVGVEKRWKEFQALGERGREEELFRELSFCILTANWSAVGGIKAQMEIGSGFLELNEEELEWALRKVGHRFPHARASYIISNRWLVGKLKKIINEPEEKAREYLVKHVKGIGWKEASHFLRNVGKGNVAILDKHILRLMLKAGLVNDVPKGWSKKRYITYEEKLKPVAQHFSIPLGKLDLFLWYSVKKRIDK